MKIFSKTKQNECIIRKTCVSCGKEGYSMKVNEKPTVLCPECLAGKDDIRSLGYTTKLSDGIGRYTIRLGFSLPPSEFGGADYAEVSYSFENNTATEKDWETRAKLEIAAPLFGCKDYLEMTKILSDEKRKEEALRITEVLGQMKRASRK